MRVAIIGGGAAGFFAAITVKESYPGSSVTIFEKGAVPLSKVKITGGGRCNLTNSSPSIEELSLAYPRGGRQMRGLLREFDNFDTINWFESRGVPLVTQEDGCLFPASQDSQSIIDSLVGQAKSLGVVISTGMEVSSLSKAPDDMLELHFKDDIIQPALFEKVIVTTGGSPKRRSLDWLAALDHKIESPVPSLFSFNLPGDNITELMGVVVEDVILSLEGSKLKSAGALLITHWGMSGPAILKLSSYGARLLNEMGYNFKIHINWVNQPDTSKISGELNQIIQMSPNKQLYSVRPYGIPSRLWRYLLWRCELKEDKKWCEIGKKGVNLLTDALSNDIHRVNGKSSYKEEFVTCGGVSLSSVNISTLESKCVKNLYFAGEVLDIDAITGGYNLQCAWTTGYVAGKLRSGK
ncbi:MAG: NAD(P)/FAD-dependent oxidoreductase [Bacteroidales bacterium]|nr:NAD(P)/FAD-dependent oxidoreductase [Bacteroidales bacterium]